MVGPNCLRGDVVCACHALEMLSRGQCLALRSCFCHGSVVSVGLVFSLVSTNHLPSNKHNRALGAQPDAAC